MTVQIIKFGDMLMGRPAGKDAFLLAESHLFNSLNEAEEVIFDFADVKVLAPSWADEFISGFKNLHKNSLSFINTENPSVKASLKTVLEPVDVSKYRRD
ncbi:STAS-like domain-containing protein [Treponema bryantii]|uniref:STAS-like domain-containing protein n=1 Tax=Treponema bryantii TaxID=163 RepID=UPI0003B330C0|nr:STAS-like domain-containing protein [Treponema bryantii]